MKRMLNKPIITEENIGINPFSLNLLIPVNRKNKEVLNKFGKDDKIEFNYEKTKFCKVYEENGVRENVLTLPIRCQQLWLYIIYSIENSKDYIYIDRSVYMHNMNIKSVNTFKIAVKGMLNRYIIPHESIKGVYWVNPMYVFKGSRIDKYKNKLKINGK